MSVKKAIGLIKVARKQAHFVNVVVLPFHPDGSYSNFYVKEDYPVVQYLRSPLFFEVALLQSTDPQIELVLENCWATLKEDRISTPRWDLIVDG